MSPMLLMHEVFFLLSLPYPIPYIAHNLFSRRHLLFQFFCVKYRMHASFVWMPNLFIFFEKTKSSSDTPPWLCSLLVWLHIAPSICHISSLCLYNFFETLFDDIITIIIDKVILATDQSNARSILLYQTNVDKIIHLTSHSAMAVSGPNCDSNNFSEYISKNLSLYELANDGMKLSTSAQANFCRNELSKALRKGPYQVNTLLGGYDINQLTGVGQSSLYYLDYMGTLHPISYGCQGYAQMFCAGIMDRDYKSSMNLMTEQDAFDIITKCIKEMHTRFLVSQPNFIIKCIDKDGIRVISYGSNPADN
jgi:20S proteasome subunit beta 4